MGFLAFGATLLTGVALYTPPAKPVHSALRAVASVSHSANRGLASNAIASEYLLRCLPGDAANVRETAMQTATEQVGDVTHELSYHLFRYNRRGGHQTAVILNFKGVCGLAYDSGLGLALSEMVPMPIAQSLTLQDYRVTAEDIGGIEELERSVLEGLTPSLDGTLPRFSPERVWALAEIDIDLPAGRYTIKEITPYRPGQFTR